MKLGQKEGLGDPGSSAQRVTDHRIIIAQVKQNPPETPDELTGQGKVELSAFCGVPKCLFLWSHCVLVVGGP